MNPCLPPHHSGLKSLRIPLTLDSSDTLSINIGGIPHLAKNERDAPNFLFAALDMAACAPFFKERRMKFVEPTKLHRKSGVWGHPAFRRELVAGPPGGFRSLTEEPLRME